MRFQRIGCPALVLAVAACGNAALASPTFEPGPSSASPALTPTQSVALPTSTSMPEPSSPNVTPLPSVLIRGEMPGPDATIPPGVPVIPNLRIETVAAMWEALGLVCASGMGNYPDSPGLFGNLGCEREDRAGNAHYWAAAIYWTPEGIASMRMGITSISGDPILDAGAAASLMLPSVELFVGDEAAGWTEDHLDDRDCRDGCSHAFGQQRLTLHTGSAFAAGLIHIDAVG